MHCLVIAVGEIRHSIFTSSLHSFSLPPSLSPSLTGGASCDGSCPPGAGCLGPNDASLCGTCRQLDDGSNTCNAVPAPSPGGVNSTAIALGIIIPLLVIILLILVGLGVWGAIVLAKRWRVNKQGSFDVAPIVVSTVHAEFCRNDCKDAKFGDNQERMIGTPNPLLSH